MSVVNKLNKDNKLNNETKSKTFKHSNNNSKLLLEETIKNSKTVVYFTHDYYSLVYEKERMLKDTAEICKAYNVEKLVAVSPIETVNYYSDHGFTHDVLQAESELHDEVM